MGSDLRLVDSLPGVWITTMLPSQQTWRYTNPFSKRKVVFLHGVVPSMKGGRVLPGFDFHSPRAMPSGEEEAAPGLSGVEHAAPTAPGGDQVDLKSGLAQVPKEMLGLSLSWRNRKEPYCLA